jgi:hypothetical protein
MEARAPNGLTPVVKSRICVASLRCSSVKYVEYSPSSRLGPLATAQFHSVPQPVRCSSGLVRVCLQGHGFRTQPVPVRHRPRQHLCARPLERRVLDRPGNAWHTLRPSPHRRRNHRGRHVGRSHLHRREGPQFARPRRACRRRGLRSWHLGRPHLRPGPRAQPAPHRGGRHRA